MPPKAKKLTAKQKGKSKRPDSQQPDREPSVQDSDLAPFRNPTDEILPPTPPSPRYRDYTSPNPNAGPSATQELDSDLEELQEEGEELPAEGPLPPVGLSEELVIRRNHLAIDAGDPYLRKVLAGRAGVYCITSDWHLANFGPFFKIGKSINFWTRLNDYKSMWLRHGRIHVFCFLELPRGNKGEKTNVFKLEQAILKDLQDYRVKDVYRPRGSEFVTCPLERVRAAMDRVFEASGSYGTRLFEDWDKDIVLNAHEHKIKEVLGQKTINKKKHLLIWWEGEAKEDATYELEERLTQQRQYIRWKLRNTRKKLDLQEKEWKEADDRRAGVDGLLVRVEAARPAVIANQKESREERAERWSARKERHFTDLSSKT